MIGRLCAWTPPDAATPLGQHAAGSVTADVYEAFITSLTSSGGARHLPSAATSSWSRRWTAGSRGRATGPAPGESPVTPKDCDGARGRGAIDGWFPTRWTAAARCFARAKSGGCCAAANPWLQRLIITAIETGCRLGELLSLTWGDVDLTRGEFVVTGDTNKTGQGRALPISPRLRAVLDMLKLDPSGKERPGTISCSGMRSGSREVHEKGMGDGRARGSRRRANVDRSRWPLGRRAPGAPAIDLHFHDLRHEAGARMLESGWPLHHVQQMLGHADVKQTSTYLNSGNVGLHDSMKRHGTTPAWQSVSIAPAGEQPVI